MSRAAIAAVVVLLLSGLFAAPVAVVAQEGPQEPQETQQEEPQQQSDDADSVVAEVDDDVRVTGYEYDEQNETMSVTFENSADRSKWVTMTEALSSDGGGAETFGIERFRLRPDVETTVDISVRRVDRTAGVMITTDDSLAAGSGIRIQDTKPFEFGIFEGLPSWSTVWFGVLVALGAVGLLTVGAAWQYVATYHDGVEDVDLKGGSA